MLFPLLQPDARGGFPSSYTCICFMEEAQMALPGRLLLYKMSQLHCALIRHIPHLSGRALLHPPLTGTDCSVAK